MQSMEDIYQSYAKTVYKFLLSRTHDPDLAEELTQETFYQAIRSIHRFDGSCQISTWLCAIAKNKAVRSVKTASKTLSLDVADKRVRVSSPETDFLKQEHRREIRAKIGELSEIYREPIMLYYFAKKNVSEISEILSISKETVKFRLYEGRKKLKKELISISVLAVLKIIYLLS